MSLILKNMSLNDSLSISGCKHATHCMIYSSPDPNRLSFVLLQMRFDGFIGFVGGGVDVEDVNVEHIIDAMNRELEEEINYKFERVVQSEWICSHRDNNLINHFFAKELSYEQLIQIGKSHVRAHHFPIESLGLIYVPIGNFGVNESKVSQNFLKNFLCQTFAGNGRQQFFEGIRKRKLLNEREIMELEDIAKFVSIDSTQHLNQIKGIEVKAMPITDTQVFYYDETVDVKYGLMIVRDNGLFDFVGNDLVDNNNHQLVEIISESLKRDLGSYLWFKVSDKNSNDYSFDNKLNHVFEIQLKNTHFLETETNFTETVNFNKTSFGLFRIPFKMRGNTEKAHNYVNRFFNGFLKQNFVNNSKNHLKSISLSIK